MAAAIADLRATFPEHAVAAEEGADGSVVATLRGVELGEAWSPDEIDLSVKLLPTFPSTPPYPFYGPAGLRRADGRTFSALQPSVSANGQPRAQISLTGSFDAHAEGLGARFAAVMHWLRNPR